GLSNTVAIIEDVGKFHESYQLPGLGGFMEAKYVDGNPNGVDKSPSGLACNYRWGEPDIANGVSGPHLDTVNKLDRINNNAVPYGGTTNCPWANNNCGPNDEPFSMLGRHYELVDEKGEVSGDPNCNGTRTPANHRNLPRVGTALDGTSTTVAMLCAAG